MRPTDGCPAVPTHTPIEIEATAPLNPTTVTAANVRLLTSADGQAVATRLVLSGSRKILAVVPDAALLPSTAYRLEAAGLADSFGGLVSVPTTSFTTKAQEAPVYDTAKLAFSFPDAEGNVSLTAPPGTLAPGTEILVINATSGFVLSFTAENDGAVGVVLPASFPATISDKLFVTITDPLGNVTSFTRSQYEDPATGRTAIGPGGGTVKAKDDPGFELRIPEGALDKGVTLKLDGLTADELDALFPGQRPDLDGATLASGLKIESADQPSFAKEVDLAFPVPPDAPEGAFFYVYRRVQGPNGKLAFQTLDEAAIVGEGADARIVTASPPFSGYIDSYSSFTLSPVGSVALQPGINAYSFLMWTHDELQPGMPLPGVVTGKVYRASLNKDGSQSLKGIGGALVAGCDAEGHPLLVRDAQSPKANVAISRSDGTFTLWDSAYAGGVVRVAAALPGADLNQGCQELSSDPRIKTATAYEVDPRDSSTPARLRSYRNVATVNVVFDPEAAPPPPAAIDIQVMRLEGGERRTTTGMVAIGTPLVLVLTAENAEVRSASLNGQECLVVPEGAGKAVVDPQSDPACRITQPGTYTVQARALTAFLETKEASRSFLVVASGGSNNQPLPVPPAVIQTVPKAGAKGVSVSLLPQVVFSEPVRAGGFVSLREEGSTTSIAAALLGVTPTGEVVDLTSSPSAFVTSVTLQPLVGLKYRTPYELTLAPGIADQTGQELLPLSVPFETFGPEEVGKTADSFGSPGIYLFDNRAYLVHNNFSGGTVRVFDVTDPVEPQEIDQDPSATFGGRPVDVVGEDGTLVVATTSTNRSKPSNLYVFDVSNRTATNWVGAASLSRTAQDGTVTRIQVKGEKVYAATTKKGLQVVDLARAKANVDQTAPVFSTAYWEMVRQLGTDGLGFGFDAIEREIPLTNAQGRASYVHDLKVADLALAGDGHRFVIATGEIPLVLADATSGVTYPEDPSPGDGTTIAKGESSLGLGRALAVGTLQNRPVAVVVGDGKEAAGSPLGTVLATVDLSDPEHPVTLAILGLPAAELANLSVSDVILDGEMALVGFSSYDLNSGKVLTVALGNGGQNLTYTGAMLGVGGRLALGESGLLFSTARSLFGGTGQLGGVRTAALGNLALVEGTEPRVIVVGEGPQAAEGFKLRFRVIPADYEIESAKIEFRSGETTVGDQSVLLSDGRGEISLPLGYAFPAQGAAKPRLVVNPGGQGQLVSGPRTWNLEQPELSFDWDDDAEDVSADSPEIDVTLASREWYRRSEEATADRPAELVKVDWAGGDTPAQTTNQNGLKDDGIFETTLETGTQAGAERFVSVKRGPVTLGTHRVEVAAGVAALPLTSLLTDRDQFPADGTSEIRLTLSARDQYGNPVADGTAVYWETPNGEGDLLEAQEATQGGVATAKYRAGSYRPQQPEIRAHVDELVLEKEVYQEYMDLQIATPTAISVHDPQTFEVELTTDSPAGPAADGSAVDWYASVGKIEQTQPVTNGIAKARWVGVAGMPYRRLIRVGASIGSQKAVASVEWRLGAVADARASGDATRMADSGRFVEVPGGGLLFQLAPATPIVTLEPSVIAGDRAEDGTFPMELPDGTVEELPYKARTTYSVAGLVPGEHVTLKLGSNQNPNVAPIAYYRAEQAIAGGVVADETGLHDAAASAGVAVVSDGFRGQGFRFDGTGEINVPWHEEFAFSGAFMVQLAVKPPPGLSQTLIEKAGDFSLALVEDQGLLKARLTVVTANGPESITSVLPVPADAWSLISARYESGRLWIGIDRANDFAFLGSAPIHNTADIRIGPGFSGFLDEVRLTDLSKGFLSAFPNGQQSLSFVADASGSFTTEIQSTGQLFGNRTAGLRLLGNTPVAFASAAEPGLSPFSRAFVSPMTQAGGGGDLDVSEAALGSYFTDLQTILEDSAQTSETPLGYVTYGMLGYANRFMRGVWSGTSASEGDLATMAGDLVGGTLLAAITTPRDFFNAAEKAVRLQGNTWDAVAIATGLIGAATVVASKKAQLIKKSGALLKLVQRGDSAGPMARKVAKGVVEHVSDLPGAGSIDNLAHVAAEGSAEARAALTGVVDSAGGHTRRIDHVENVLRHSQHSDEMAKALGRLQARLTRDELFSVLSVVGSCALQATAATPAIACPAWTDEALDGVAALTCPPIE